VVRKQVQRSSGSGPSGSDTRAAIIRAAGECFRQYGLHKTTVTDIARMAGLSRATIYQHFRDKAEIVEASAENASKEFYEQMAEYMSGALTLEEQFARAAVFVRSTRVEMAREEPTSAGDVSVLLTEHAGALLLECIEFLKPYIIAAKERREVRLDLDVEAASEWFARILFSLFSTPASSLDMDDPRIVRRFVEDHVVRGFSDPKVIQLSDAPSLADVAVASQWVSERARPSRR
jgi:AcrR family transcriptional regulator